MLSISMRHYIKWELNHKMNINNEWTIIQNNRSVRHYQFERLNFKILDSMNKAIADYSITFHNKAQLVLKLFECFLQISHTNSNILRLNQLNVFIKPFIGALWSDLFFLASNGERYRLSQIFLEIIRASGNKLSELIVAAFYMDKNRAKVGVREYNDDVNGCIALFSTLPLIEEHVYYWRGWWAYNKTDMPWFVPLTDVYHCYGRAFTERLFSQLNTAYIKRRRSITPGVSDLCRWLPTAGYTLAQFNEPVAVEELFQKFLLHFMTLGYNNGDGSTIKHLIKRWRTLITFVENYLLGSIFAAPRGKLVVPAPAPIKGGERRIRTIKEGIEVKEKLLTDVPLHLTDEQAIELLFNQIQIDYDHIVNTAINMANDLWEHYQRRKRLSSIGKIKPVKGSVVMSEQERQWFTHKNNPSWLENACATFEADVFSRDGNGAPLVCSSYSITRKEASYALGLPKAYSLIPYMVLLVAEHPNIVASFLTDFELYDKQGKLTGFVELDNVWVLDGRKRRRGPVNAQQVVILTENSKSWVEQIIAITDCVRQYFKIRGNGHWRYLFLTSGYGFSPERMCSQYAQARRRLLNGSFYDKLRIPSPQMTVEHANKLSERFDLGALRASKGVLVYLKTRSVKTMAQALGHKEYSPKTLSHYLPAPVFDFFQSRWIQIFQQGIIVKAMKNSPLLLGATEFSSINEFHEFMKNHALKNIPQHLENPYHDCISSISEVAIDEIVFNINTAILTLLLSLQQAVLHAKKAVSDKAAYWSEIASHLVNRIENGSDHGANGEFKCYLTAARKQLNAVKMEAIVYA